MGFVYSILHKLTLTFSPPDKSFICLKTSSPVNSKHPSNVLISCGESDGNVLSISSYIVFLGSRLSNCWEKYAIVVFSPKVNLPANGFNSPIIVFNNVDLPIPFSPIIPSLSPLSRFIYIVARY